MSHDLTSLIITLHSYINALKLFVDISLFILGLSYPYQFETVVIFPLHLYRLYHPTPSPPPHSPLQSPFLSLSPSQYPTNSPSSPVPLVSSVILVKWSSNRVAGCRYKRSSNGV